MYVCVNTRRRRGVYVRVCEHEGEEVCVCEHKEEERGVCTCV